MVMPDGSSTDWIIWVGFAWALLISMAVAYRAERSRTQLSESEHKRDLEILGVAVAGATGFWAYPGFIEERMEAWSKIVCDPDCHPGEYEAPWGWDALWDAVFWDGFVMLGQAWIVCGVGLVIGWLIALCTPRKSRS